MKDNREKILNAALRLFNDRGVAEVSTNLICETISISPGNLYYHFKNKDEIVMELFHQMIAKWNDNSVSRVPDMQNLLHGFELIFEFLWEYRFIHRELLFLYRRIEPFRILFKKIQGRRIKEIKAMIHTYVAAKIFKTMTTEEINTLTRSLWFFSLYWMSYMETEGTQVTKKNLKQSSVILHAIFMPYILPVVEK